MDSSESSIAEFDHKDLRRLLHSLRESIKILGLWTDDLAEGVYEAVHIQLNNVMFTEELVVLRFDAEVGKQIQSLPGADPTVPLPSSAA